MAHSYSHLLAHIIFSTKQRSLLITPTLKPRLLPYMGGIVRELKGVPLILNGTADHVHMLAQLPAKVSVEECVRVVKTNSSRWVHQTWPGQQFGWQTGYAAFSVSHSNLKAVANYIERQEEHHRKISFQQELVAFLVSTASNMMNGSFGLDFLRPLRGWPGFRADSPRLTPWATDLTPSGLVRA